MNHNDLLDRRPIKMLYSLFNADNLTAYDELTLKVHNNFERDGLITKVIIETLDPNDSCEIKTAKVSFNHIPLDLLFSEVGIELLEINLLRNTEGEFTDADVLAEITRRYGLATHPDDFNIKRLNEDWYLVPSKTNYVFSNYIKVNIKHPLRKRLSNVMLTSFCIDHVISRIFKLRDVKPFVINHAAPSIFIRTFPHNFPFTEALELNEDNKFKYLVKLNSILTTSYELPPITDEMFITERVPNAQLGDRVDCDRVCIVKPSPKAELNDTYYFHYSLI